LHLMCCAACRHSIRDLYASVDECLQAIEAICDRTAQITSALLPKPLLWVNKQ
jgi:hypothetical protein